MIPVSAIEGFVLGFVGIGFLWAVLSYLRETLVTRQFARRNGYSYRTASRILRGRRRAGQRF